LLGEGSVGGGTIQTNSENFRIRGVNLTGGDSSLDRLKLLRSTVGESQDVNGEEHVFLAAVLAELYAFPLIAEQGEIRGGVADLKGHPGDVGFLHLLCKWRRRNGSGKKKPKGYSAFHEDSPIKPRRAEPAGDLTPRFQD
jgi:hypothetical protein